MICEPGDLRWLDVVQSFERTAFRLEQQPIYLGDVNSGLLNDWLAGATEPTGPNDWSRMIAGKVADGCEIVRVRVLEDPPTPYQQWIRWYSHKNLVAGERHRYMTRPEADQRGLSSIDDRDFWLLDGRTLVVFTFDGIRNQTVEVTDDPDRVGTATTWWKMAVGASEEAVLVA